MDRARALVLGRAAVRRRVARVRRAVGDRRVLAPRVALVRRVARPMRAGPGRPPRVHRTTAAARARTPASASVLFRSRRRRPSRRRNARTARRTSTGGACRGSVRHRVAARLRDGGWSVGNRVIKKGSPRGPHAAWNLLAAARGASGRASLAVNCSVRRRTRKIAPPAGSFSTNRRPRCASTIVRLIVNPACRMNRKGSGSAVDFIQLRSSVDIVLRTQTELLVGLKENSGALVALRTAYVSEVRALEDPVDVDGDPPVHLIKADAVRHETRRPRDRLTRVAASGMQDAGALRAARQPRR